MSGRWRQVSGMGIWNILSRLAGPATPPRIRSEEEQQKVDQTTSRLALYQFDSCPFCIMVNRAVKRLNLDIPRRNIHKSQEYADQLLHEGGKQQVPCLCISHPDQPARWLYESRDIIRYLEMEFPAETGPGNPEQ